MKNKIFRSRQSRNTVAVLALWGSIAVGLLYVGGQRDSGPAGSWLVAAAQAQNPQGAASEEERPIRLVRDPVRQIKNEGAIFSAVAVDPVRNEIVMQD